MLEYFLRFLLNGQRRKGMVAGVLSNLRLRVVFWVAHTSDWLRLLKNELLVFGDEGFDYERFRPICVFGWTRVRYFICLVARLLYLVYFVLGILPRLVPVLLLLHHLDQHLLLLVYLDLLVVQLLTHTLHPLVLLSLPSRPWLTTQHTRLFFLSEFSLTLDLGDRALVCHKSMLFYYLLVQGHVSAEIGLLQRRGGTDAWSSFIAGDLQRDSF